MRVIQHSRREDINFSTNVREIADAMGECAAQIAEAIVRCETAVGVPVRDISIRANGGIERTDVHVGLPVYIYVNSMYVSMINNKVIPSWRHKLARLLLG